MNSKRRISILGSTGSIGTQEVEVIEIELVVEMLNF